MHKPAITPHPAPSRGTARDWPGAGARPTVAPRHRARHTRGDDLTHRLLIALGFGAGAALIAFGLFLAVAL